MRTSVLDFWWMVDIRHPEECWVWKGGRQRNGYGYIGFGGRQWSTHRLAYTLGVGDIAPRMLVCHHCDNPPCCNPQHLYQGTELENRNDAVARGRMPAKVDRATYRKMYARYLAGGCTHQDIADELGVHSATVSYAFSRIRQSIQSHE